MNKPVFNSTLEFEYGAVAQLSPLVQRVVAPNPSPFTFYGTGTYIIGTHQVAVIDPGPNHPEHLTALRTALKGREVTHLVITHTHLDHSPAAATLQKEFGAPTFGYGPHGAGVDSPPLAGESVEEGADLDFDPDTPLKDGDVITGADFTLEAVYTPGHTSNHLCYSLREENVLFTGDHVMGWSTTVVSPPDGDMGRYISSLRRLLDRPEHTYWPTHGDAVKNPGEYIPQLLEHRKLRESQVLQCLKDGYNNIERMVEHMYQDVPSYLHPAAARSVLAHLILLCQEGKAQTDGPPRVESPFSLP